LRERLINQQRPRRHGFEFGLLHREERIGIADKRAEDQRQQECDEADDRKYHVLGAARHMVLRQPPLNIEPDEPAPECHDHDRNGYRDGRHWPPPFEFLANRYKEWEPGLTASISRRPPDRLYRSFDPFARASGNDRCLRN
jgi:hypothetical protein